MYLYLCSQSTNALFIWVKTGNKKNATESIPKTMENNIIKKIQRVNAAPRKLIIKKEYKCNQKSPVCFVLKIW